MKDTARLKMFLIALFNS